MSGYENKLSLYEGTEKTIMVGKHCVTNTCTFQMICRHDLFLFTGNVLVLQDFINLINADVDL